MKRTSRVVSVVFVLLMIASLFGTEAFAATANNNPSSDVAARTTGTGTGKSTNTSSSSVSNFKSLKKKTKLEKKAYNNLKKIEKAAIAGKWNVKRVYTREKLAKKYQKTWVITTVYLQSDQYNWTFRHCYHKSGKVVYQWKNRKGTTITISKKDVYGLIKNPASYYKE